MSQTTFTTQSQASSGYRPNLILTPPQLDAIQTALIAFQTGQPVVVVDDENRENEGDLICAAQFATPATVNFMATQARGLICLAMTSDRLDQLKLPPMVFNNTDPHQTAFTVSIDAASHLGGSNGMSAEDRARTIQVAINPSTKPEDLKRPGHVFPLRAKTGGVLQRTGHTEAAVDLARLAGLYPAGVICEIQNPDGSMARLPQLITYARLHGLKIISIADLIRYRLQEERVISREAIAQLPTEFGNFQIYGYRHRLDGSEAVALVKGNPDQFKHQPILVRLHSSCFTGDVFGSLRCDSRQQLKSALHLIETEGQGVLVYLPQEGKEIGLLNQIKAYSLQEQGLDPLEANRQQGFDSDLRHYSFGAQILQDLNIRRVRLLTNNYRQVQSLQEWGLEVDWLWKASP